MKIFTDSASDLPKTYYEQHDVTFFPLRVLFNGKEYEDVIGIDTNEIYTAIQNGAQPKTSQVSPNAYYDAFEQLAISGEEGLYIAFSSALSGTYQTALMIRNELCDKYPNLKLTIIDSKCASFGQGMVVQEAVRLRDAGAPAEDIIAQTAAYAARMEHIFTVADLDYLARGGRVSKTSAFVGGLLNIKPILHVEDGKLIPIEKVRGHKKSIQRIIELMKQRGGDFSTKTVGISHSNDEALLQEVIEAIEQQLAPRAIETTGIGSVIGAHVGLGTIAIFFERAS